MDRYTDRLERTLVLALQQISQLRDEKMLMRAEAKCQCDLTLDVVTRQIGRMSELLQHGSQLQTLVNEVIHSARGSA